jgi:hypothetical protein
LTSSKKNNSLVEEKKQSNAAMDYRAQMESYFSRSVGSNVEKLNNFTKYVSRQALTRFLSKYEIFKLVLPVQGSIVECGVFMGGGLMTWALLSSILEPVNHQRKVIGFDTFNGIPDISDKDRTSTSEKCNKGGLAVDSYDDLKECIELFDQNRFLNHIAKVELVRGDIVETVPRYLEHNPQTVVSLLYLDAVVYKPTVAAIKHFRPRMPKGSCIVFDQLNSDLWHGETIAVMEELGVNNLRIQRLPFDSFLSFAVVE